MITELLEFITISLDEKGIPYMLSGGVALNAYSIPRLTRDIDVIIEMKDVNLDTFMSIFDESFYLNDQTIRTETRRKGMFNIIDKKSGYKIDFIVRKESEYRILEFKRKVRTNIFGIDAWIVTLEDLIISKIEWIQQLQSEKQIEDIKTLLLNPLLDKDYLVKWCDQLHLNTFDLF